MGPKLRPTNEGPMDIFVKHKTDNHHGESSQPPNLPVAKPCVNLATSSGCTLPLTQRQPGSVSAVRHSQVKQEEEPHETHSFDWHCSDKKPTTITCNKAGTVEDALKRNSQFKEIAGKCRNKELVILRDGRAISSHCPCSVIKNEHVTVKYLRAVDKLKQSDENRAPVRPQRKGPSDKLVMFHVLTNRDKNVMKVMRNPALKRNVEEITVYAYKGEKVKQALRRDGRLKDKVFKNSCALSNISTEVTTEMSSLVDDLDGKTFKIILLNKSSPPESQPGSFDDAYMMQSESQRSESDGNQDPPQQSTTAESVNDDNLKDKPKPNGEKASEKNQETMHLSLQFKDLVKGMKTQQVSKFSRMENFFPVEYGKNAQTRAEVKTMKKLMDLSDSVCQVRVNGTAKGSGFLLFDKFVLTNGHVVKNICNETVTVHFSFESLDQTEGVKVEEVVGFEHCPDVSGHMYDWALLKLDTDQTLPDCLLTCFGFLPQSGRIYIIGHPDGGVKNIASCLIIPSNNRNQVLERHRHENQGDVQRATPQFFEDVAEFFKQQRHVVTYESCFYFGSSGSPVLDKHCSVVAMHSGGFVYRNANGETQSVLEYGYPLSVIIEHIIVQIVERGRFDVLKKYLSCDYAHYRNMLNGLKKLVESRNLTAFQNAAEHREVTCDKSLKTFFEFFSQREEPIPMDTD